MDEKRCSNCGPVDQGTALYCVRCWEPASAEKEIESLQAENEAQRGRARMLEKRVCRTCDGAGIIGGPSYSEPDEGGEECPDCKACDVRKQAEAVRDFATHIKENHAEVMSVWILQDAAQYIQRLRQRADEIERGEP